MNLHSSAKELHCTLCNVNKEIRLKEREYRKYPFDLTIEISEDEYLEWCSDTEQIVYMSTKERTPLLESSIDIRLKSFPFLNKLEQTINILAD